DIGEANDVGPTHPAVVASMEAIFADAHVARGGP
ncbi:MAG: hypothetical protein RLZZ440_993, partial [Planctomycetota bacterium]